MMLQNWVILQNSKILRVFLFFLYQYISIQLPLDFCESTIKLTDNMCGSLGFSLWYSKLFSSRTSSSGLCQLYRTNQTLILYQISKCLIYSKFEEVDSYEASQEREAHRYDNNGLHLQWSSEGVTFCEYSSPTICQWP